MRHGGDTPCLPRAPGAPRAAGGVRPVAGRLATMREVTETIPADDLDLVRQRAGGVLSQGGLVVVPTDTTYAVLVDAFQTDATQRLFAVREADRAHPLPVIVRNPRQLPGLVKEQSEQAKRLIAAFWPGALTLVFRANVGLAWDLGETRETVAVRMPDEPLVYELVAEVGPLACTSAAPAGAAAPRTVEDARAALGDAVAVYVDGGPRPGGRSTIVDVSRGGAEVLRVGAVSADEVFAAATGALDWGRPTGEDGGAGDGDPPEDGGARAGEPPAGHGANGAGRRGPRGARSTFERRGAGRTGDERSERPGRTEVAAADAADGGPAADEDGPEPGRQETTGSEGEDKDREEPAS
jgi:L-threonylcarbamoyladenylate synthase